MQIKLSILQHKKSCMMKEIATLKGLMVRHLQSIFEAENMWSGALAETAKVITDTELKRLFKNNSKAAADDAAAVQKMLTAMEATSLDKRNAVTEDLIAELREVQQTAADREVLDAALIVTHQCLNHYLIAKYGTVASYARLLDRNEMAAALHKMMEDKKQEDKSLTKLAEKQVNEKAKAAIIL
jgi:ferritin-like metal-binding protein YciE